MLKTDGEIPLSRVSAPKTSPISLILIVRGMLANGSTILPTILSMYPRMLIALAQSTKNSMIDKFQSTIQPSFKWVLEIESFPFYHGHMDRALNWTKIIPIVSMFILPSLAGADIWPFSVAVSYQKRAMMIMSILARIHFSIIKWLKRTMITMRLLSTVTM